MLYMITALNHTVSISKDNEAARGGSAGVYENRVTFRLYVEEADDAANKVSQRNQDGITSIGKNPGIASGKTKHGLKKSHILACNNINFYPYDTACGDRDD